MKADRKTTKPISRGKSKTQKASPTHKTVAPKPHVKKTEPKLTEKGSPTTEENYRSIFEQAPLGIFQSTPQGRFRNVNSAMAQIYGYDSPEQMITEITSIGDQVYVNSYPWQEFQRILAERGEIHNSLDENYRKDGSHIWTQTTARAIKDKEGNVLLYEGFIIDVTERLQEQQQLRESEERFRALIENASDMILTITADGNLNYVSPAALRITGYQADEVIGRNIVEFIHADDLPLARQALASRSKISGLAPDPIELRFRHKDGVWRIVEILGNNLLEYPAVKGIVLNVRDSTERKQAEAALRESEDRYRDLVENSQDLICTHDLDGQILSTNPRAEKMLGYEHTALLQMNFRDILAPEARPGLTAYLRRITKRGADQGQMIVQTKTGERRIWEYNNTLRTEGVSTPIVRGMARDITERKRAEEALELAHSQLTNLYNNLPQAVFSVDMVQNKMLQASPAHEAVFGYSRDEFFKNPQLWYELIVPEDKPIVDAGYPILFAGRILEQQFRILRPDGKTRWIEAIIKPILAENGELVRVDGIASDITERKRAEDELRAISTRQEAILAAVPDILMEVDKDKVYTWANPAGVEFFGEDVIGNKEAAFYFVGDQDTYGAVKPLFNGSKDVIYVESWQRRKDGEKRLLAWWCRVLKDTDGNVTGALSSAHDITGRKHAEDALRAAEEKYRTIFEGAVEGIFQSTPEGRFLTVNPALVRMWGYASPEELISSIKDISQQVYAQPQRREEFARQIQENGEVRGFEYEVRRKDGELMWVSENARAVRDASGTLLYYEGNIEDITERKQAEEALREREVFIETVLDNLPVGVAVNSVDPNVTFHYMNDNFPRFYRTTREKLADPDAFWSAVYEEPDFREEMKKRVLDDLASGNPQRMSWVDVPITHKGEKPSFITARNIPIPDNPLMVSTVWDVTERKNLEDSLRQRLTELDTLHTVSTVLRTVQTRDEALPILLDEILTALETDAGAIWLYQADSGELHPAVERGWFGQLDKTAMKPGEGIAGTVFDSGQAHLSTEFARDPLARSLQVGEIPAGWGGICLPIRSGVIMVGVLFASLPLPRQITPEQEKLLESLSGMAGATLHRMSLHEETVRQLDRLEALRSIDLAISASMDLRMTLNVLLEQVARQLNVDAADVLLLNPHTQTLDYVAGRGFRTHSAETAKILLGEDFAGRAALERCTVQIDDPSQIQRNPHFSALWAGEDFAAYFGVPLIVKAQVRGVLEVYHRTSIHPASDWINFLETIAGQAAIAIDSSQLFENLQRSNADLALAYDTTIEGWSRALDLRDEETEGHTQRVTELTLQLAKAMGMGDEKLVHIRRGGLLHDIGKMGVPDGVLLKPGKLTDEEWVLMRKHPALAYELLSPIAYLREALDIPYCHHEKWDGTGYPRGLKGEQIPLAARLFAMVDVWDALRSDRPYRKAWDEGKVREHILSLAGTHFDPNVVPIFLELMEKTLRDAQQK